MEILKALFGSKKFVAAISFIILMIVAALVSHFLGVTFTEEQIYSAAGVVASYLVAQGAADLGKEKAAVEGVKVEALPKADQ